MMIGEFSMKVVWQASDDSGKTDSRNTNHRFIIHFAKQFKFF